MDGLSIFPSSTSTSPIDGMSGIKKTSMYEYHRSVSCQEIANVTAQNYYPQTVVDEWRVPISAPFFGKISNFFTVYESNKINAWYVEVSIYLATNGEINGVDIQMITQTSSYWERPEDVKYNTSGRVYVHPVCKLLYENGTFICQGLSSYQSSSGGGSGIYCVFDRYLDVWEF